jgi:hypothetical protein
VVNQYIVTIAPVASDGSIADAKSQMLVRIEVSDGEPHVVELTVRAATGVDLTSAQLPPIDIERLAQAFGSQPGDGGLVTRSRAAASRPARRSGGRSAARTAAASRTSNSTAAPSTAAPSTAGDVTAARAYRRMPEAADLQKVYADVGSIAGVAKHYGVPTHTAQGWIGRLRRKGIATAGK